MSNAICSVPRCPHPKPVVARGWCSTHYQRWLATGDPMGTKRKRPADIPFEDWFLSMCKPVDGCLVWQGTPDANGYGHIDVPWDIRQLGTHIVSWVLSYGPVPDGLSVLHRCDNPPCCFPDHLFLGTRADNVADMMAKGRGGQGSNPLRGGSHQNSKLTEEDVRSIRIRYAAGGVTYEQLGAEFGVGYGTIGGIVRRDSWGHVE